MNRNPSYRRAAARIILALAFAAPVSAQEVVPVPTPNADRLAEEMRVLAREPRNVRALLSAGELSARLNDPSAAAGFFARAQALDPTNPRVFAGQAMVMVRMERPGEALRLFADAARGGLSMADYASDRALAYDLIGAQAHAQRDHRVAMRRNPDDETIRRYALSLGISGKTEQAMEVMEPLLRRSDRAAWRARAFILAMNGDAAGADKIAANMMGGFGTALSPFFRRLPSLAASDKAFAVHFGEMRRTPARIADASVAPPLPQLPVEPGVAVAAAPPPPRTLPQPVARRSGGTDGQQSAPQRRRESERERRLAARRAESERETRRIAEAKAAQEREAQRLADLKAQQEREAQRLADVKAQQEREAQAARQREAERVATAQREAREAEARRAAAAAAAEQAARDAEAKRVAEAAAVPPAQQPAEIASAPPPPAPPPPPPAPPPPAQSAATAPPGPAIGREDNVIARIIAGITIPASELGVDPMPGKTAEAEAAPEPTPAPPPAPVQVAKAEPAPAPAPRPVAEKPKPAPVAAKAREEAKPEAKAKVTPQPKPKPDPAKAEPARHWAQVAGGADVRALPREWARLLDKAPAEFRGKQAWTTPLRFTNRLLTGPFKTPAEAQAFVNAVGRKGVSAFAWTSEAGQKIEKLAVK